MPRGLNAELLQESLEIVVASVFDDDPSFLRRVQHGNPGAEVRGELFLDALDGRGVAARSALPD